MQVGDYLVEIIPDTEFRLDGGAMFGVVPRTLWSQECPPAEQNRIRMNMNCVFIDTGSEKILIETGIGVKWPPKHATMYGIERERPLGETLLMKTGVRPEEITIVINTHLHFDHAGGNTTLDDTGCPVPAFRKDRYLISRAEIEHADQDRSNEGMPSTKFDLLADWSHIPGAAAKCNIAVWIEGRKLYLALPISC